MAPTERVDFVLAEAREQLARQWDVRSSAEARAAGTVGATLAVAAVWLSLIALVSAADRPELGLGWRHETLYSVAAVALALSLICSCAVITPVRAKVLTADVLTGILSGSVQPDLSPDSQAERLVAELRAAERSASVRVWVGLIGTALLAIAVLASTAGALLVATH